MKYRTFVCSFTGAIGDMKPKDQRSAVKVLAVLVKSPRFSVFDATERPEIARTLDDLKARDLIEYPDPQPEFPWNVVNVTDKGKALLKEAGL